MYDPKPQHLTHPFRRQSNGGSLVSNFVLTLSILWPVFSLFSLTCFGFFPDLYLYYLGHLSYIRSDSLPEVLQEQWSKAHGIFNKAGTVEKLGEMPDLPSYVPPTRQPRPGVNDDVTHSSSSSFPPECPDASHD